MITRLNNNSISSVTALPSGVGGKVLQVVEGVNYSVISTTSTSLQSIVSVNITPSSSSNKIFLIGLVGEPDQQDGRHQAIFYKGGSRIGANNDIINSEMGRNLSTGSERHLANMTGTYLDTAGSTSQITYAIYWGCTLSGNTARIGNGSAHKLTAMEIAT